MQPITIEEINELKAWFETQDLPQTMQIDKATFSPNLKLTVKMLLDQSVICHENPKMQGSIVLLKKIKAKLEENQSFGN